MGRKGLNKEKIITAAAELSEEKGFEQLNVLELAEKLNIKSASIYNHFTNFEEIQQALGDYAVCQLIDELQEAMGDKVRAEAIRSIADTYVTFARKHPSLYKAFIASHLVRKQETEKNIRMVVRIIFGAFNTYELTEEQCVHWGRIMRSMLHGFAAVEGAGWFSHLPYPVKDTLKLAVENIIVSVESMERINRLEGRPCGLNSAERFVPMLEHEPEEFWRNKQVK